MIKSKKIFTASAVALFIGATSLTAFAASNYKTPAEVTAKVTGKTLESVKAERINTDKSYGSIAKDAGKLNEFKKEALEMKKDNLKDQVEKGTITQEKADEIIKKIQENQANCDGTGSGKIGKKIGAKFGSKGKGQGIGGANKGEGQGQRRGENGAGMRLRDGSCNLNNKIN